MKRALVIAVVMLCGSAAFAQMEGLGPVVAPNGTVIVTKASFGSDHRMLMELVAISSAGARLWSWQAGAGAGVHSVEFGDGRLFVSTLTASSSMPMLGRGATGAVVALSVESGAVQWRRELPGAAMMLEATGDRVYVISVSAAQGMRMPGGARTLTALNAATGAVLWNVSLE